MWAEYRALLAQIRKISRELLPDESPTARYASGEILRMIAFRLSAHAEIEGFLELCSEKLLDHYASRNRAGTLSRYGQRVLLLHSAMRDSYPPRSLNLRPGTKSPIQKQIQGCLNMQGAIIEGNNGVSEKDVLKLFVPLGFDLHFFDLAWLDSMETLARARGEAAHKSWLGGTTVQPSPSVERSLLALPLFGMRQLLREIDRLKSLT